MAKKKQTPLRAFLKEVWGFIKQVYEEWRNDRTMRLGAGIAYYGIFALVPLIFIIFILAGLFFSIEDVQNYLIANIDLFTNISGEQLVEIYEAQAELITGNNSYGLISIGVLLFAATLFIVAVQDALNIIFKKPVQVGWKKSVYRRVVALGIVLLIAGLVVSSIILSALLGFAEQHFLSDMPILEQFGESVTTITTWVLSLGLLTILFKVLIYDSPPWLDVIIGAAFTAVLIYLGTKVLTIYISSYGTTSVTGAAGSVFATLVWIYYIAQIILVGGQFMKVLSQRRSGKTYRQLYQEMKQVKA